MIYTDFEKAFDNVDHQILIAKLHSFGVRGKLLELLKSYLSKRTQKVRWMFSSSIPVASGVPQGSLLGPLLFLIFINDLPDSLQCFEPYLCADDAKFLSVNTNKVLIETDLSLICNWSLLNMINFNVDKCVAMTFSRSSSLKDCQFVGAPIVFAQEHKDLGLYIADNLNWDAHVEEKCSKANKVFSMMKGNSPHISVKSKLNLYKTMVLPIMMYASCCWHASVRSMRILEAVQKRVTMWILPHCENYKERLLFLNLLPVSLYLQLTDLLMLSKLIAGCIQWHTE